MSRDERGFAFIVIEGEVEEMKWNSDELTGRPTGRDGNRKIPDIV